MRYTKSDMVYTDYNWNFEYAADDPKVSGNPDHTELDRLDGNQMLYFINKLSRLYKWQGVIKDSYEKLEKAIRTQVPGSIKTQDEIKKWIEKNHKSFWNEL
jgi:hypothetical protein